MYLKLRKKIIRLYQTIMGVHTDKAPSLSYKSTKKQIVQNFKYTKPKLRLQYYKNFRIIMRDIKISTEYEYRND